MEEDTENYNRELQVLYVKCSRRKEIKNYMSKITTQAFYIYRIAYSFSRSNMLLHETQD